MHEGNRSYDVVGTDRLLADGASPFSLIQPHSALLWGGDVFGVFCQANWTQHNSAIYAIFLP